MFFAGFLLSFSFILSVYSTSSDSRAEPVINEPTSFRDLPKEIRNIIIYCFTSDASNNHVPSFSKVCKEWKTIFDQLLLDKSGNVAYQVVCKSMIPVESKWGYNSGLGRRPMTQHWGQNLEKIWIKLKELGVPKVALNNIAERFVQEKLSTGRSNLTLKGLNEFLDFKLYANCLSDGEIKLKEFVLPLMRVACEKGPDGKARGLIQRFLSNYRNYKVKSSFEQFKEAYKTIPAIHARANGINGGSELDLDYIENDPECDLLELLVDYFD